MTTPAVTAQRKHKTRSTEHRPPKGIARLYFRFVDHQNKDFVRSVSSLTDSELAFVVRVVTAELDVRLMTLFQCTGARTSFILEESKLRDEDDLNRQSDLFCSVPDRAITWLRHPRSSARQGRFASACSLASARKEQ